MSFFEKNKYELGEEKREKIWQKKGVIKLRKKYYYKNPNGEKISRKKVREE
jgi:hypothetical protein